MWPLPSLHSVSPAIAAQQSRNVGGNHLKNWKKTVAFQEGDAPTSRVKQSVFMLWNHPTCLTTQGNDCCSVPAGIREAKIWFPLGGSVTEQRINWFKSTHVRKLVMRWSLGCLCVWIWGGSRPVECVLSGSITLLMMTKISTWLLEMKINPFPRNCIVLYYIIYKSMHMETTASSMCRF